MMLELNAGESMTGEEGLVSEIVSAFPEASGVTRVARARRVFTAVSPEHLRPIIEFLRDKCGFTQVGAITGLDEGPELSALYHITRPDGMLCTVKTVVSKESPKLGTVSNLFPVAELYERELVDLLGFVVEGLPEGKKRYPLPDDWPEGQYPLRKDFKSIRESETQKSDVAAPIKES